MEVIGVLIPLLAFIIPFFVMFIIYAAVLALIIWFIIAFLKSQKERNRLLAEISAQLKQERRKTPEASTNQNDVEAPLQESREPHKDDEEV